MAGISRYTFLSVAREYLSKKFLIDEGDCSKRDYATQRSHNPQEPKTVVGFPGACYDQRLYRIKSMSRKPKAPLRSKTTKGANFPIKLTSHQRDAMVSCTRLTAAIKRKIKSLEGKTATIEFTRQELDHIYDELSQAVVYAPSPHKKRLDAVQTKVFRFLDELDLEAAGIVRPEIRCQPSTKKELICQFKITLLDIEPVIWRRIQVKDYTLDQLHEHIQNAMGWTNSHLHQFRIKGELYGDPALLESGYDDFQCCDSTTTAPSTLLPKDGRRFPFVYEYDFGDGWRHEILFEGYPELDPHTAYPSCLEGERACPPEDVGGPWGYPEYLAALADPTHEQHEGYLEWNGPFDPEAFSVKEANQRMQQGLADWQ